MTIALVIRHGQAEGNADHRFIGQTDVPLDALGRHQAEALAKRLTPLPIKRILSSDLSRARDTIAPAAEGLGLPVETDSRLREVANGAWTGLLPSEIQAGWPEMWEAYAEGKDVERPGGENWKKVRLRVVECVGELAGTEDLIAISTHGGPALCLVNWSLGLPPDGNIFKGRLGAVENVALNVIDLEGPRLLAYNDLGHVPEGLPRLRLPFFD
ncbi:MAG TPA: histidine phosphatase family protein [Acidimicrobiia bacterium]|nr:histidine phosphatase family protein [Acidimicrobiia bacterium]